MSLHGQSGAKFAIEQRSRPSIMRTDSGMRMSSMAISKVLLVDDDQDLRRIAELSLTNVGRWSVLLAASGQEGLDLACRQRPDVILLDVMMPGMDGPTTLALLQGNSTTADIPVIFLTAKVQSHEVDSYIRLGALGVIIKPFDPMTLPLEIQKMVGCCKDE
jgi:two-component system, OmpR family, response regulator